MAANYKNRFLSAVPLQKMLSRVILLSQSHLMVWLCNKSRRAWDLTRFYCGRDGEHPVFEFLNHNKLF